MSIIGEHIAILYKEYRQKLYIHAYNLLNDKESAKDVVNDVFCSLLENDIRLKEGADPLPFLYIMVRNRCIDHIRHKNVAYKNEWTFLDELYNGWTAEDYREYEEKIVRMQNDINRMAPQMRAVVEDFFFNGHKCSEISEKMNISDNTVRTHIARALKILRRSLHFFF